MERLPGERYGQSMQKMWNITVELVRIKREIEAIKHDNTIDKKRRQQKLKELNQRLTSKTKQRQFQIKPEKRTVTINLKVYRGSTIKNQYTYKMLVFPVNIICTAITGHKLQDRSKDILIVSSWTKLQGKAAFTNREYTVLWIVMLPQKSICEKGHIQQLDQYRSPVQRPLSSLGTTWSLLKSMNKFNMPHKHRNLSHTSLRSLTGLTHRFQH
jgi:hypothetical protein